MYLSNCSKLNKNVDYACLPLRAKSSNPTVNCVNMINKIQASINNRFVVHKTLRIYCKSRNGQLATFRGDLKGLTSLTSRPNIALNAVKFYPT